MKKIKASNLKKLGFVKEKSEKLFDGDTEFHYYTYEVSASCLLITDSNHEKVNGGYVVRFFEFDDIEILDLDDLEVLLAIIKKTTK